MLVRHIFLRMLSYKIHCLVDCLYSCHVCSCIVCKLHFFASSDMLCTPVKISEIYRTVELACYGMKTCFPSFGGFSCSFRRKREMGDLFALHLSDDAKDYGTAVLSIDRDASELAQKPSERSPEHLAFNHAVWLSSY